MTVWKSDPMRIVLDFDITTKCYMCKTESILENETYTIMDFSKSQKIVSISLI